MDVPWSTRTAVAEYHRLGGSGTTEIHFSQSVDTQDLGAHRSHFLGARWLAFAVSPSGRRGQRALWGLFMRALIPFMRAPPS